jgi:hypothetical protein
VALGILGTVPRRLVGPALALVSVLVSFLLIEVALGVLGYGRQRLVPQPAGFWRHDPRLGWHHTAGSEGVFDRSPVFRTRVRINDKGLRGRDYPYERVAGRRRILVLGDSFVFGYGVEQEEIFTTVLEGLLPATEVINAGVSGYGTDQELLWFRAEGARYRPDLVILLMCGNDELDNHSTIAYSLYPKPLFVPSPGGELVLTNVPVPPVPLRLRLKAWLLGHSRVAFQASRLLGRARHAGPSSPRVDDGLTLTLVETLRREATANGARFLVAATEKFWSYDDRSARDAHADLLRALRGRGITAVDIEGGEGYAPEAMTITGDGHWNARGHQFVARLLEAAIRHDRLLPP